MQNLNLTSVLRKIGLIPNKRRIVARSVTENQRKIWELSKANKLILLEPVPPKGCRGNVEHYYHFIFDLIFPLYFLTKRTSSDTIFVVRDFGIYTERLKYLFPNRIRIESKHNNPGDIEKVRLIGMNPNCVYVTHRAIDSFSRDVCSKLGIELTGKSNKILLIERMPPDSYFKTQAVIKGGGASRRSILNHKDLASTLSGKVREPFEFHNLQLEKISFKQQIEYFSKARIVIAQHGAGLANCIWMKPKSIVIELSSNESLRHFRIISKRKKHQYFRYETSTEHATIDTSKFLDWILGNVKLKNYFN